MSEQGVYHFSGSTSQQAKTDRVIAVGSCLSNGQEQQEKREDYIVVPENPQDGSRTFREIVHQYCKGHPWARFGIDLVRKEKKLARMKDK
mgnify:CR=1 FL=1